MSWPPPKKETGQHAGNAATRKTDSARSGKQNPSDDRREYQGIGNARQRSQRPPRWNQSSSGDALSDLEAVFGKSPARHIVKCQKHSGSGAMVEYGRYVDPAEADRVCGLLRWAGAVAIVEVAS